jgi:hypothetical protein
LFTLISSRFLGDAAFRQNMPLDELYT